VGGNGIKVEKRVQENSSYETNPETAETTTTTTTKYIIQGLFTMWVSQALRVGGSGDIGGIQVEVESETPPTVNIYELLYNKLKTMKTCIDAI